LYLFLFDVEWKTLLVTSEQKDFARDPSRIELLHLVPHLKFPNLCCCYPSLVSA
jgi:hypothetical protein